MAGAKEVIDRGTPDSRSIRTSQVPLTRLTNIKRICRLHIPYIVRVFTCPLGMLPGYYNLSTQTLLRSADQGSSCQDIALKRIQYKVAGYIPIIFYDVQKTQESGSMV